MKFKHLALCCVALAVSPVAFAAPDLSTLCSATENSCTSLTPMSGGIQVKSKTGAPMTADAWQIQCANDTTATSILYGFSAEAGAGAASGYRYFLLSPSGVLTNKGSGDASATNVVKSYCTTALMPGPNNTTVPRKPLSDWYPPKNG